MRAGGRVRLAGPRGSRWGWLLPAVLAALAMLAAAAFCLYQRHAPELFARWAAEQAMQETVTLPLGVRLISAEARGATLELSLEVPQLPVSGPFLSAALPALRPQQNAIMCPRVQPLFERGACCCAISFEGARCTAPS